MGRIESYRDLIVWQRAVEMADRCYALTSRFPSAERYGLTSQIRRAAVSIAANIAEGHARSGAREFGRFLSIARGSLRELETLSIIAARQGFGTTESHRDLATRADELGRMLHTLSQRMAAKADRRSLAFDP